jgi:hypothetical protein
MDRLKLDFTDEIALSEGAMHTEYFVTGAGSVGPTLISGNGKVLDMRLVNSGTMVQLTIANPSNPKKPRSALVPLTNFKGITPKEVSLSVVK